MDKTKGELLQEELMMKPVNGTSRLSDEALDKAEDFSVGYKKFMDAAKIEIEAVKEAIALLEKNGYHPFERGKKYQPGERFYYNNRGKSLIFGTMGKRPIEKGVKILAAHVDSPRLDIKPSPLFENCELGYLRPHYYGGIKKYQWTAIPLALHGAVILKDGRKIEIKVGEDENDPVFYINDLLPHLAAEQMAQNAAKVIEGEQLNVLVGGLPYADEDVKEKIKLTVLSILNEKYGMCEEDFLSAELSAVPAFKARDVGFDRALIGAYGHDDRVCSYPALMSVVENESEHTVLAMLVDKEEIGSEGTTGLQCEVYEDLMEEIAIAFGANFRKVKAASKCLSADVTAAYDPNFAGAYEKKNAAMISCGAGICKFTGSRGKSGSNDASAEFLGEVRQMFAKEGVVWQTAELGKVDIGGGGTVAKYVANMNIDTVDIGVPVVSMHAPYEVISKADLYSNYRAFVAFMK